MAKKAKQQLEYESWRRRLQAVLINMEGAASLWGGCISEAEYCGMEDPQHRFIEAMDEPCTGTEQSVSESIGEKLWCLVEDLQKAIEDGEAGLKALKENGDD